ncbi:Helicase conserved C-terminal domain-containing protein [Desulfotomaculum arcticum]|uniref:Helicase conserved C-terminal domain-containing protein n=1 Tax=Desulfotruncus arcticus DSM 17038 TaxID=1121424 RepID=A0A1I2WPW5_9FIRM|nr:helicase-related protein [Desulfotruncus arcticus]SFH03232.1 Helicase conserved C-terminal domain-containing protein [Desulfotomaculum arcticum] [Desulfotruncus arcticus DSM 17038]
MAFRNSTSCVGVVEAIQDNLPALYFVFSRGRTEQLAEELGREWDFLLPEEKARVEEYLTRAEKGSPGLFAGRRKHLQRLLQQGIGYHHAGLAPALKELVENLYEARLIFVLFCTETFAVGINFPAASTVFDATRKWDGRNHRNLYNREFFQMAGRAGRRGFDKTGHVYVNIDEKYPEQTGFFNEEEVEPVHGRLIISPNTVLSLLHWKTDAEIEHYLSQNLAVYQNTRETRDLADELETLEQKMFSLRSSFCEEKDGPSCPLLRNKLKKELNRLRNRRRRKKPEVPGRIAEIKSILAEPAKSCLHDDCRDAHDEITALVERKKELVRRNRYLKKHASDYHQDFQRMCRLLEQLGYIEGKQLLPRGLFALHLHVQEILVTELIFSGIMREASPAEAACILAGIDYMPGRDEVVLPGEFPMDDVAMLRTELLNAGVPENLCVWSPLPGPLAEAWYKGATFEELQKMCNLHEGDIFSVVRREIDILRQIERAAGEDASLKVAINDIRNVLDRDEMAVLI